MRPNYQVVPGTFLGGEIEGGVFHHFFLPEPLPRTGGETGVEPASDERVSFTSGHPAAVAAVTDVPADTSNDLEVADTQA